LFFIINRPLCRSEVGTTIYKHTMPKPGPASGNKYMRPVRKPVATSDLHTGNWCGMAWAHVKGQSIVLLLG
jgi:hypothetical protein